MPVPAAPLHPLSLQLQLPAPALPLATPLPLSLLLPSQLWINKPALSHTLAVPDPGPFVQRLSTVRAAHIADRRCASRARTPIAARPAQLDEDRHATRDLLTAERALAHLPRAVGAHAEVAAGH